MSVSEPLPFGNLLRRSRLAAGLSQEALAGRAGLGARTVSDLERGVATQPRLETVDLLATALALDDDARAGLLAAARPSALLTTPRRDRAAVFSPPGPAPLVGRERELALVTCLLDSSGHTTPPLLLLGGEPGIGKSRLLHAAAEQAMAQGWRVLIGSCRRGGGQDPYSPLIDVAARYLLTLPPEHVRTSLKGCAWLIRLLPELGDVLEPLPTPPLPPEQERRLLFTAMARFLTNIAGPAGTLLILDDLQWAGSDALDLLAALLRAPLPPHAEGRDMPTGAANKGVPRVVGAYRDTEVRPADPLNLLATDLTRAGLARQHLLGPLEPDDAAELLAALLAGAGARSAQEAALVPRVVARARGMPFFLVSYAQALRANQDQEGEEATLDATPWDVAQGIRLRVALRSEQTRKLLGIAAIVGQRIPWALLVRVSGLTEEEVLTGLEDACRARLLIEDEHGTYTFAHDVIREVVESDLGTARRALLHRGIAEALRADSSGASPESLAYHYARAGMRDKAARYLEQAGDQAWARRAPGAADQHYRDVVADLEALGRMQDAIRVREKWGDVLCRSGLNEAVIEVLEPAAHELQAAEQWEHLARVTARIAEVYARWGRPREGLVRIQPLLDFLEPGLIPNSSAPMAILYEAMGMILVAEGRYDEALAANERAATLARVSGDDRLRARADGHRVNLLQLAGRLREALRLGQEVLPLAEAVGDLDIIRRAHGDLAYVYAVRGSLAEGRRHIHRMLAAATRAGDPGQIAFSLVLRGWLTTLTGDWQDAAADLDHAVTLSRQVAGLRLAYAQVAWATLALGQGNRAVATLAVQEALVPAETTGDLQALRWVARIMAELDLAAGRTEAAIARLVPLLDRPGREEYDATALLPVLAWAYLKQGRVDQAVEVVERAIARARPEEMRLVLVDALRVRALTAMRRERWDEGAADLTEGIALARSMPYPYAEARLLHVAGMLHARKGESEPARERFAAALALFTRLGARADAARARWALGALPGAPAALPEHGLPGLPTSNGGTAVPRASPERQA